VRALYSKPGIGANYDLNDELGLKTGLFLGKGKLSFYGYNSVLCSRLVNNGMHQFSFRGLKWFTGLSRANGKCN